MQADRAARQPKRREHKAQDSTTPRNLPDLRPPQDRRTGRCAFLASMHAVAPTLVVLPPTTAYSRRKEFVANARRRIREPPLTAGREIAAANCANRRRLVPENAHPTFR